MEKVAKLVLCLVQDWNSQIDPEVSTFGLWPKDPTQGQAMVKGHLNWYFSDSWNGLEIWIFKALKKDSLTALKWVNKAHQAQYCSLECVLSLGYLAEGVRAWVV